MLSVMKMAIKLTARGIFEKKFIFSNAIYCVDIDNTYAFREKSVNVKMNFA